MNPYSHEQNLNMARRIAECAAAEGGVTYFTGGYVRDVLREKENKDIDIEVHRLLPEQLERILEQLGTRIAIGESFGVYNLKGYSLDIAMPRKEENRGKGHRDFDVCVDPWIGTYKAALRRDFTVNAMMQNVLNGEIVDHFNGQEDLRNGVIRHVNPVTFAEDPLRVLRAAQLAARLEYSVAPETVELCRGMDLSGLPRERILGELEKALRKAARPSVFFSVLREMNQLSVWFRELQEIGTAAWERTMRRLDAAACYRSETANPLGFMLAALVCGFAAEALPEEDGLSAAENFLQRLTNEKTLLKYAENLFARRIPLKDPPSETSSVEETNLLFDGVTDPEALLLLFRTEQLCAGNADAGAEENFLRQRLAVFREIMSRPCVMGRDLIAAGLRPTERFSAYLNFAHCMRLAGVSKEEALRRTLAAAERERKEQLP